MNDSNNATDPNELDLPPVDSRAWVPSLRLAGVQIQGDMATLFGAMARAQRGFKPIERTRTVKVASTKGDYTFDYAPHENVIAATRDALNAEGLTLISLNPTTCEPVYDAEGKPKLDEQGWPCQMVREYLHTILGHESGACIAVSVDMGPSDSPQKYGSKLTYARRYAEGAITGTSPEYDDDGNHASGNTIQAAKDKRRQPDAPKPQPAKPMPKDQFQDMASTNSLGVPYTDEPPVPPGEPELRVPDLMNAEQVALVISEGKRLGWNKVRMTEFSKEVTGMVSANMTRDGADKLVAALRDQ
jgi:hypothetical protein